jgi:23S rRNA-intervening sequence protein
MNKQKEGELEIFVKWTEFLEWLLPATAKFPRKIRHTFAERIENLALDVAEELQEARYSSDKRGLLRGINMKLEKLRLLLRLSHKLQYLPHSGYEHAARSINEVGRMLGSWINQQNEKVR